MAKRKKGLGKGLDALLGDAFVAASEDRQASPSSSGVAAEQAAGLTQPPAGLAANLEHLSSSQSADNGAAIAPSNAVGAGGLNEVPIEFCQRGKYQPRRDMDPESLEELASSIKNQGIMQPIVIRSISPSSESAAQYEIIAGERRWRAAQLAGLATVPAIVKEVTDEAAIAMALIENLQREDLNPMEEAYALSRLQQEFDLTHQQIAETVGRSRAAVSNTLRLMALQKDVKTLLENGDLEMGHARALLGLPENRQSQAAKEVINKNLTVRQTEALVKQLLAPKVDNRQSGQPGIDPNIRRLQDDLSEKLGVPVIFQHGSRGNGKLVLKYNSLEELDGILEHIK